MANAIPNDLGPNAASQEVIPQDLAGYQNIVTGLIQQGDILVTKTMRFKMWAPSSHFGECVEHSDHDVYRKIDVPRHDGETKWQKLPMHDGQNFYIPMVEKAKTDDSTKPPLAMLPWKALRKVAAVQAYGFKKYGDFHNYKKGMEISRQLSCAIRHISDYMDGNDLDPESGESHLAHAATRLLFALENIEDGTVIDNRFKK